MITHAINPMDDGGVIIIPAIPSVTLDQYITFQIQNNIE